MAIERNDTGHTTPVDPFTLRYSCWKIQTSASVNAALKKKFEWILPMCVFLKCKRTHIFIPPLVEPLRHIYTSIPMSDIHKYPLAVLEMI
jgi:hypothetical protein